MQISGTESVCLGGFKICCLCVFLQRLEFADLSVSLSVPMPCQTHEMPVIREVCKTCNWWIALINITEVSVYIQQCQQLPTGPILQKVWPLILLIHITELSFLVCFADCWKECDLRDRKRRWDLDSKVAVCSLLFKETITVIIKLFTPTCHLVDLFGLSWLPAAVFMTTNLLLIAFSRFRASNRIVAACDLFL